VHERQVAPLLCHRGSCERADYAPLAVQHTPRPLETALVAFVQAHEVVMMHEARPQVAAGKNAQIDVRVSKLREEWIANESIYHNS
jgi:hypothetical protein